MENNTIDLDSGQHQDGADFFPKFNGIVQCLDNDMDIETCLKQLAELVADSLATKRCSLMLVTPVPQTETIKLKICAHFGDLPSAAYDELIDLKEGISGQVIISGKPLLVKHIGDSAFKNLIRFSSGAQNDGFIICPLIIAGAVIGVINISRPSDHRVFSGNDLKTATIIAMLISQTIQIYQLKNLFRSNFVKAAIAKETHDKSAQALNELINNNDKAIKVLAKSFYGELKKAGFSRDLIIGSASEIISLVTREMTKTGSNAKGG